MGGHENELFMKENNERLQIYPSFGGTYDAYMEHSSRK